MIYGLAMVHNSRMIENNGEIVEDNGGITENNGRETIPGLFRTMEIIEGRKTIEESRSVGIISMNYRGGRR